MLLKNQKKSLSWQLNIHKSERIEPKSKKLKDLTDLRLKSLFDSWRKTHYEQHCDCCDSNECIHNISDEQITKLRIIDFNMRLIQEELATRGNIPNSKERKLLRKNKAENTKKRKGR